MITDPYKVLNVDRNASDDEVKKAYRELARKYHPDNYHGSAMEEMAEEKMKEINEAYAMIQKMRKGGEAQYTGGYSAYGGYNGYGQNSGSGNPLFQRVRMAINQGNLAGAEDMLNHTDIRTAEWHFLMGAIYYRRGWLDEAMREFEMACSMEPNNMEYRQAYQYMQSGGASYRPAGYGSGGMDSNWCNNMLCNAMLCSCLSPCC